MNCEYCEKCKAIKAKNYKYQEAYRKRNPDLYRELARKYYNENIERRRVISVIYRLRKGENVKQSTLIKYNLNPDDYKPDQVIIDQVSNAKAI